MTEKRSFTLIELLMVMAIIGVLVGILLPTLSTVRKAAKVTQAKSEISSLMIAIKMYETTYGYLPFLSSASDLTLSDAQYGRLYDSSAADNGLIDMLQNNVWNNLPGNPRGIRMLDVNTRQGIGFFDDPWGNRYRVVLDTGYNGDVTVGARTIYGQVAVWSSGPNGTNDTGTGDDVVSWE